MSALQRDFLLWKCMCGVYVKHNDALGVTVVLTCAVAGETTTFVKSSCSNRPDPSTITIGFVAMHWNYPQVIWPRKHASVRPCSSSSHGTSHDDRVQTSNGYGT
jgi:hypothetical protein